MPLDSPKYKEAEDRLPPDLKPFFQQLVTEYEYLTAIQFGRGYVAYQVLAELILSGWRPAAETHPASKLLRRDT